MFNILRTKTFYSTRLNYQLVRNKITLSKVEASKLSEIQRPTPILLIRTDATPATNEWTKSIQEQFSNLGYYSVDANISLPEKKTKDELLLQTCYQELNQATTDLSFFPPLIISYGEIASRISQKFVSNKPASGLIMIEQQQQEEKVNNKEEEFPTSEFEPRFPLLMISNKNPPEFLDGWIDHVKLEPGQEFKDLMQWMDEIGM